MKPVRANPMMVRLLCGVIALATLPFVLWNGFTQQLNSEWNDLVLRLRPVAQTPSVEQIVLLAIDDRTAARFGPLPIPRDTLAAGLAVLASAQPSVLAVDLLLSEPSAPDADAELAAALRRYPHLVLGAGLDSDGQTRPSWIAPLSLFANQAAVGHVHASPDADGDVRSVVLAKEGANTRRWALGLEAARLFLNAGQPLEESQSLLLDKIRIPARSAENRPLFINYAGPEGTFRRVSFSSLLEGIVDPATFRNKIVIVGVTAQGGGDRMFTPVSAGIGMSGIEIHANVIRTILDQSFLRSPQPAGEFGLGLLVIGAAILAIVQLQGRRLLLAFVLIAASIFAAGFAGIRLGLLLPTGSLTTLFVFVAAVASVSEHSVLRRSLAGEIRRRKEYAFRVQAVAHEIKSPLTAIQGSSEMISESWVPEKERIEMAGLIYKESKRLTGLVRTFLSVERLASGGVQLEKRPVALRAVCEEVVERGRLYAARKRIRVELAMPQIEIKADGELLAFALYNLITNGVKYSPKDTAILMTVQERWAEVIISVADQGQGISPAERDKIFEKFYRGQREEKSSEEGTGIGLALVKEIVEQHGGRISVESQVGAGSRFAITLPKE
jgi:signal transduction histidine kinase